MTVQEIAEKYELLIKELEYPKHPDKPLKLVTESHAEFGERMDAYEQELETFRNLIKEYRQKVGELHDQFRQELFESLNIPHHPKREKLYSMAWEQGHSSGLSEVAQIAEDLTELL